MPASMIVRGSWLVPSEPFAPAAKDDFNAAMVEAKSELMAEVKVADAFTTVTNYFAQCYNLQKIAFLSLCISDIYLTIILCSLETIM